MQKLKDSERQAALAQIKQQLSQLTHEQKQALINDLVALSTLYRDIMEKESVDSKSPKKVRAETVAICIFCAAAMVDFVKIPSRSHGPLGNLPGQFKLHFQEIRVRRPDSTSWYTALNASNSSNNEFEILSRRRTTGSPLREE
jgi:hypothetical protein